MRRAAKKDGNHNEIADHLRSLGWSVLDLSRVGDDCPDAAVGRPGFMALVEIKMPGEKLTPGQEAFRRERWDGPWIATSPDQIAAELYIAWKGIE
jgi:hypothetical protein